MSTGRQWRNSQELEFIRAPQVACTSRRDFLVFVVPGKGIACPFVQMSDEKRNFDLAVRFYEEPGANDILLHKADFVMTGGMSKFHAAYHFLKVSELQSAYDGYLFLDGDLEFDLDELNGFLAMVRALRFDLAQPAVTRDSYCYWKMAYHQPEYLFRRTSFVEVMAPYFSRVALLRSMETFPQSISTYGLDLVWPSLVGGSSIGVIDAFQIRHKEQVDHKSGSFYRYLSSIGVDLNEDEERMLSQYRVSPSCAHSLRGYFRDQSNSPIDAQLSLKSVALLGIERFTSSQAVIDLAMRTARRGPSRQETDLGQQLACLGVRRILPATS